MILMTGEELSNKINLMLKQQVKGYMIKPCLAIIQIGDNEVTESYIKSKIKTSDEVGIYLKYIHFPIDTKEIEIINKIVELNNDDYVNGISIELPLPEKYNREKLINYIARNKDVEGLTDLNLGKIYNNKKTYVPCVAQAVLEMCNNYNIELAGKHAVIINRSSLVGKPLAGLLLNNDATVTICHSKTENLSDILKCADIVVTAVGIPNIIKASMLKKNAVVFDIGLSKVDNKLCGDVDLNNIDSTVSYITPAVGGIGPVVVSMLLRNVVESYQKMNNE